jgi:hypothetical protein
MMETIRSHDTEEDPSLPLYRVNVTLIGGDGEHLDYEIEEIGQGVEENLLVCVLLQLAARHMNELCGTANNNGRGVMLLQGLAGSIRSHYETHHRLAPFEGVDPS